ncbi:MAG: polysaccharide biosynthesis/export family protein [Acidobacteria bacterium]|nr:polysaccharide biosynthesis/export family protein [Acidobacteriota bacterium]
MQARILLAFSIVSLAALWAAAQSEPSTPAPASDSTQSSQVWTNNLGDEPVGAGDLVYISVTGSPEFTRSYRVSNDGNISIPLVPKPVSVMGLAPAAIANRVSDALIRDRILVAPIVSAAVLEYKSRQVTVAGAVNIPVIIQATGALKLLDAIARAHGVAPDAGAEVIVSSFDKTTGNRNSTSIPIKDLLSGEDPKLNIALHGGEEVRVPEAAKLFVTGNVKLPGLYRINDAEGSSVLKAMALSQGILPDSAKQAYVYRMIAGAQQRQEIAIPLQDIMRRKAADVPLEANDILYVPASRGPHLATILKGMTGLSQVVLTHGVVP